MNVHDEAEHPKDPQKMTMDSTPNEDLQETIDTPPLSNSDAPANADFMGHLSEVSHPTEIGGYRIVRVIGEGGMGTTYEAVQSTPRRRVAVKVIRAARFTESALRRFEYESQILARLTHPGIAQIYEAGMWTDEEGTDRPFMAMEYVDGTSLTNHVSREDISSDDTLRLFQEICHAVHYSHQQGVIHRDLKPDNILVRKDGQPKVIDFGVARVTDSDIHYVTQQTNMGQLIGTLQYMSPEQVEFDTSDLDTRSDVYALGVILYEILCGSLPYNLRERALHEAVRVIREDPPQNPSTFHKYLRGDVETITLKALEKNRNRRYGSADDLASDIRRYLENDPIEARPPSLPYRLSKFCRKHKAAAIAAAAVVLSITAGGITSALGWAEASKQSDLVEARNEQLDASISEMLNGVMGQIKYLGNSATAQRKLMDLAKNNVEAMAGEGPETPLRTAQLAVVLMRIGRSHLSTSGVGYGSLDEARAAFLQAGDVLDSIDVQAVESEKLAQGIRNMKLDRIKYLAELERAKAINAADATMRTSALRSAADHYRDRIESGKLLAASDPKSIKALDVQMSSHQGLGNVLWMLEDSEGARAAFVAALDHANKLESLDEDNRTRRMRDRAIALQGIALIESDSNPMKALPRIKEAIEVSQALVALDPDNARRPRDLALMLAIRGKVLVAHAVEVNAGIEDYTRCADLLTTRAVESPREATAQTDLRDTLLELADVLEAAGRSTTASNILNGTITELTCVASAEARAGDSSWTDILESLNSRTDALAGATIDGQ